MSATCSCPLVYVDAGIETFRKRLAETGATIIAATDAPTTAQRERVRVLVVGGVAPVARELVDSFPALHLIVAIASGYDGIDLAHAKARGIAVTSSIGANAADVADVAVGLLIAAVRGITRGDRLIRDGGWGARHVVPTRSVGALDIGIVGLGAIGRAIADRMVVFGCRIAWHGPRAKDSPFPYHSRLVDLAHASDVLILAAPATPATHWMINATVLDALGPTGFLINVGRGALVDEDALITALREGRIAGAGLDVFAIEPTPHERWRDVPNAVLTPHIAGVTREAFAAITARACENVRRGLAGELPDILIN